MLLYLLLHPNQVGSVADETDTTGDGLTLSDLLAGLALDILTERVDDIDVHHHATRLENRIDLADPLRASTLDGRLEGAENLLAATTVLRGHTRTNILMIHLQPQASITDACPFRTLWVLMSVTYTPKLF